MPSPPPLLCHPMCTSITLAGTAGTVHLLWVLKGTCRPVQCHTTQVDRLPVQLAMATDGDSHSL